MKKTVLFLTMLLLASLFCIQGVRSQATVVDIIVNSPDHDTLEAAIIAAGLNDDLSAEGPFTVFAPTDAAFKALPYGALDALLADPTGLLADLLLCHVTSGSVTSDQLTNGQLITTLFGKNVTVTISGEDIFINNAKVTLADLEADNGVVHVIDAVIIPNVNTVMDIINNSPAHDTLEFAINYAGLADDLSGEGPFTVFAPTDDAFKALPPGMVEALLPSLEDILLYHVAPGKVMSGDLSDGQEIVTLLDRKVNVTVSDDGIFINNAKVIIADLVADNGVVHVIDAVLIPQAETVLDIIAGSAAHDTLEAAVIAAGLDDDLSGEGPFTVFAPTDDAFKVLPEGTLEDLLADPTGNLADILLYHVVNGKVMSGDLSNGQEITTLLGKDVIVTISNDGVFINNAKVTVADLQADNGVVHVIDAVLIPEVAEASFPIDFETETDAVWTIFANGTGAPSDLEVIANPDKTGINASDHVLKFVINTNADAWAGFYSDSYPDVEFTQSSHTITMMVWKSITSPVTLKVEESTNGGATTELKVNNTLTNQWEKITFDFSSLIGYSYSRITIIPDFPDTRTSGTTVYIDNIEILETPTGLLNLYDDAGALGIFPNPASDRIQLSGFDDAKEGMLRIINTSGVEVENRFVNNLSESIDISRLDQGAYFLIVETKSRRYAQKLLVK
jgi:uncharacterized surface protein with fasciclin (FAS1) repeats